MAGDPPETPVSDAAERIDVTTSSVHAPRLDLLKALGDNTRYAIYLEIARSPLPLATADIADTLGLHVNTVRPHLERMREVGLLDVGTDGRGGVGRPQHRYSLSAAAPSLGLEPSPFPTMARMLLAASAAAGVDPGDLADAGRDQGAADAAQWPAATPAVEVVMLEQARWGFDPEVVEDDHTVTVAFAHCPFRELASAHPELVCALHRGLVEGTVAARNQARHGDEDDIDLTADLPIGSADATGEPDGQTALLVRRFHSLLDRDPCHVELVKR
jgi:predicted ArsR family transcriptional regulator